MARGPQMPPPFPLTSHLLRAQPGPSHAVRSPHSWKRYQAQMNPKNIRGMGKIVPKPRPLQEATNALLPAPPPTHFWAFPQDWPRVTSELGPLRLARDQACIQSLGKGHP